jgi:hypothetical protein
MTDLCKLEFDWKTQTASLFVDVNKIANEVAEQLDEEVLRVLGFEKVKHGRWDVVCNAAVECSCCSGIAAMRTNYCPKCGAKMDGDGNG